MHIYRKTFKNGNHIFILILIFVEPGGKAKNENLFLLDFLSQKTTKTTQKQPKNGLTEILRCRFSEKSHRQTELQDLIGLRPF